MSTARALVWQGVAAVWPWLVRLLTAVIIIVVLVLLYNVARNLDWAAVYSAARGIDRRTLALAFALTCLGYLVYSGFDVLARRFASHALATWKIMGVAALSYALNLNLGVLLGGVGVRLRLYRKMGVRGSTAAQVVLFSTATNWLGYCWVAGALFAAGAVPVPTQWDVGASLLQGIGAAMLALGFAYVFLCGWSKRRHWTWRAHRITLPDLWIALAQNGLAVLSWGIMAAIIFVLLEFNIPYYQVLSILLFSSIAAVIVHIPGGLGVTEGIFVAALAGRLPDHQVLAALLVYRLVYGLIPLAVALVAYVCVEGHFRRRSR